MIQPSINDILSILKRIAADELDTGHIMPDKAGYINQRALINSLFEQESYGRGQVMLRLTVIDSLYSTNAAYSYFSFEEMAERIIGLGSRDEARRYFYSIACMGNDTARLFDEPYGIQKDLLEGSKQMSLLSKYAYYELAQQPEQFPLGFPIYDRLAKITYPVVCRQLGLKPIEKMTEMSSPAIEVYVKCLNQLRQALFAGEQLFAGKYQQFDILDAYLWRMGKFDGGNLSLLLGRDDYCTFIRNIGLAAKDKNSRIKSGDFDDRVRRALSTAERPFKGCGGEEYLTALLQHWQTTFKPN